MGRVSVLQLDTKFLRIPGDIGCEETFVEPPQYLVVKDATVRKVVTSEDKAVITSMREEEWIEKEISFHGNQVS